MSIQIRVELTILVVVSLLAGCSVPVNANRIGSAPPRPPVSKDSVRLFFSTDYVTSRYEPIAVIGMGIDWNRPRDATEYTALRARAGRLGANAVILGSYLDANGNPRFAGVPERGRNRGAGMAIAVVLIPPAPTQ